MPTVTQVDLSTFSFGNADFFEMSLSLSSGSYYPVFYYWSGILATWTGGWVWVDAEISLDSDQRTSSPSWTYYYPGNRGDYYVCEILPYADRGFVEV